MKHCEDPNCAVSRNALCVVAEMIDVGHAKRVPDELLLGVHAFIGLMVYGIPGELCPRCIDNLEFRLRCWRAATGHAYTPVHGEYD